MGTDGLDTIGGRIRAAREAKGWSAKELASEAGIHDKTLSALENDRRPPDTESLSRLSAALGRSSDWLLRGSDAGDEDTFEAVFRAGLRRAAKHLRELADALDDGTATAPVLNVELGGRPGREQEKKSGRRRAKGEG